MTAPGPHRKGRGGRPQMFFITLAAMLCGVVLFLRATQSNFNPGGVGKPADFKWGIDNLHVSETNKVPQKVELAKKVASNRERPTKHSEDDDGHGDGHHGEEKPHDDAHNGGDSLGFVQPLLPASVMALYNRPDRMVDLDDPSVNDNCQPPIGEKESSSNIAFRHAFTKIFKQNFSNLPWMLDEGGLIGSGRAGAMANADDDFDFFVILPNQHAPCRTDSLTCTKSEFDAYIHEYLMVFWNEGMCINKFNPDPKKFVSRQRLMYSFQLNRKPGVNPEKCFIEGKPFAHMHLGMFTEAGQIKTNIWAKHTTHPMDELDLDLLLPVRRCRAGPVDVPCPNNVTGFLTVRNRGEYRKKSSDGSCLLVRRKWGEKRKKDAVSKVRRLYECGYNSMVDLAEEFEKSGYRNC